MEKKIKKSTKKISNNISHARAYITATFNNTIVTLTDNLGNTLAWGSAGAAGFKGARKSTPYAATTVVEKIARSASLQ